MATITVRALDKNWEPIMGNGQNCFLSDINAVAQIIAQRLKFLQGEWWENRLDGFPLKQKILGAMGGPKNIQAITSIITSYIGATPYVKNTNNLQVTFRDRVLKFSGSVETQFGTVYLSN